MQTSVTKRDALTDAGIHESILPCFRKRSAGIGLPFTKKASELRLSLRSFFMAGRSGALSGAPLSFLGGKSNSVRPATRIGLLVAGFGKDQSKRGYAMSQGVKGRGTSDVFDVLADQEKSITKLECFINAAKVLVGHPSQNDFVYSLYEICLGTIEEIDRQNAQLYAVCFSQEEKGVNDAHVECTTPTLPPHHISKKRH